MDNTTTSPKAALAIFKAGSHTAVDGRTLTFSEADIQAIADSYDPALSEAPLVVGHPDLNAPAYGWAHALHAENGVLYAEPHQVEPQFAEMTNAGRFKKISASIYLADTPGNPTPGKPYLRHIGFLGAAAPAVKGLKSASFAESDEGAASFAMPLSGLGWSLQDLFQRLRDWLIDNNGLDAANNVIPQWQIRSIAEHTTERSTDANPLSYAAPAAKTTEPPMTQQQNPAEFAARETALTTHANALAQREQALAEREAKARRDGAAEFAEQLVNDGKLLPRQKPGVIELMLALPESTALNFAEGGSQITKPAGEFLRELLGDLPKQVDFAEKSSDDRAGGVAAANFSAPAGTVVDAAGLELHGRAIAYQNAHAGTSYLAAVKAVGG